MLPIFAELVAHPHASSNESEYIYKHDCEEGNCPIGVGRVSMIVTRTHVITHKDRETSERDPSYWNEEVFHGSKTQRIPTNETRAAATQITKETDE